MNDFGLLDMLDSRFVPEQQDLITPGPAVAGLILTGVGFAHRPLGLTPPFVASTYLARLVRKGIAAAMFNRFQLGRPCDDALPDGGDQLVQEVARAVWAQAGFERRVPQRDTTSVSRSGEHGPDREAYARTRPRGDATDHRPDLPQAVLALQVSPDSGRFVVRQNWEGQPTDR
jgi:hypothetical protein